MNFRRLASAVLAVLMLAAVCFTGVSAEDTLPFTDVKKNWSYEPIKFVYQNGLMNGTGGDKFSPQGLLTRAMVVTVLYRNAGSPKTKFSDVFLDVKDPGKFFSAATVWAYKNGIVTGTGTDEWGDPYFSPNNNITRQELATMFARYAKYCHIDTSKNTADISSFPDNGKVAKWAGDAIRWAVGTGLITGKANGGVTRLAPKDTATRAEFAAVIKRFIETDEQLKFSYLLSYEEPVPFGTYTEPDYPLVEDADLYVSPTGDDSNPGTKDRPLRTFAAAADAAKSAKASKNGEFKIAFMAGTYDALENVTLEDDCSGTAGAPVTFCAYGDGEVIFNSGITLPAGAFTALDDAEKAMFPEEYRDEIKKVSLYDFGIDGTALTEDNGIFAGKTRLDSARWPNKLDSGVDDFVDYTQVPSLNDADKSLTLSPTIVDRIKNYHNIDDMHMLGYYKYDWSYSAGKVLSFDPETGVIHPTVNGYGVGYGREWNLPHFFFYNIPDELDCASEYYIDKKTNTLYAMDPSEDLTIGHGSRMLTLSGTSHMNFVGLTFCYGASDAIYASGCNNITFDRCSVHNIRGKAIFITGDNNKVIGCTFYDTGMRSVEMIAGDRNTLTLGNGLIENCLFDSFGSVDKTGNSAIYVWGCGIRIAHNEICNSSNIGIIYSEYLSASNYITIEYNYLHNVVTQTNDSGAIYAGRNIAGHGSVVRYNLICDIGCPEEGFNPFSIYLDDYMSGQEVYGNVIFNNEGNSIFMHGGRDNKVYNNVLISPEGAGYSELRFSSDIYDGLVADEANLKKPMEDREIFTILETVPYNSKVWAEHFPSVAKYVYNTDYMLDYIDDPNCPVNCAFNEVYDNYIISSNGALSNKLLETYTDNVLEYATRIDPSVKIKLDENPLFVDPTHGNYATREDSPLNIPFEKMGRY